MWLDHITSSGLGLDDTSTFDAKVSLRPNLIRRWQACSWACSEATDESVRAFKPEYRPATLHPLPGDNSCVEPPDPIPNSEVKRARADGSVYLACESRSSPGSLPRNPVAKAAGFLFVWQKSRCRSVLFQNRSAVVDCRDFARVFPVQPAAPEGRCDGGRPFWRCVFSASTLNCRSRCNQSS